jgi:hypothetical protein
MNPQHSNHYYNLEFSATAEQLDLQRDVSIRELVKMTAEGSKFLGGQLVDEETEIWVAKSSKSGFRLSKALSTWNMPNRLSEKNRS